VAAAAAAAAAAAWKALEFDNLLDCALVHAQVWACITAWVHLRIPADGRTDDYNSPNVRLALGQAGAALIGIIFGGVSKAKSS